MSEPAQEPPIITIDKLLTSVNSNSYFDYRLPRQWMSTHWHWSFYIIATYLVSIYYLKNHFMANRKAYDLRRVLTVWNFSLAAFSISATLRTFPELVLYFVNDGFFGAIWNTICVSCDDVSPESAYWAWLFVLSKVIELGDTAFIIFRKQPLIFLHWYHHITVLLYSWFSYGVYIAPARWFVVMNFFVHSLMYTYYGFKSLKFRIPRQISMFITCLQLSQMVLGIGVNVYAWRMKDFGHNCDVPYDHLKVGFVMYGSYFALFLNFFWQSYFGKTVKVPAVRKNETETVKKVK